VDRIRKLFLIIGSVFMGIGMTVAGLIKISQDKVSSGITLILGTVILIILCSLPILYSKKDGEN